MLNLSNWPVSRRLFAVIVAALLMGVIFGGLRVADAEASATQFSRVSQLANLGQQLTIMVGDLQNERDATLSQILGTTTAQTNTLAALQNKTSTDAVAVQQAAAGIGGGFPANIQADAAKVAADTTIASIRQLHGTLATFQNEDATLGDYDADISDMITLADQVSQGAADASLTSDVQALNGLALAEQQASEQRGLINYSFTSLQQNGFFNPGLNNGAGAMATDEFIDPGSVQSLSVAYDQEFIDEAAFQSSATPAETSFFSAALGANGGTAGISLVENFEENVFGNNGAFTVAAPTQTNPSSAVSGSPALVSGAGLTAPGGKTISTMGQLRKAWAAGTTDKLDAMRSAEQFMAGTIASRASQLKSSAQQSALTFSVITLVVLLIVLLAALAVARSLVRPLRRLRAGALDIASVQLPERVKLLSESPDAAAALEVAPINVSTEDEIGQVARAFDQVHSEAVRLAGEQALLRSSFNAMFVNLSRRSQSLIERLARTIDTLEQSEDDPDRLGNLFSMDHMVTRMRRNSENLLLLAGHENPRKWSEAIALADVARAATSEIEQYNRVVLNIPPGIAVIGPAVSDVVHLIAELVENATIFSPKDTQVQLSMQELASGGVLIEILDKGIGVTETRLADMNFRLDNPPAIDVSVSRHMGLFAVARLAERHRVRVRLRPAAPQGLSALVWLPDSVIERTSRYGSVQSWSTQPTGSQTSVGARQASSDMALDSGTAALAQNSYGANGGGGGNAHTGNGHTGNGHAGNVGTGRETRSASGWFRGQVAGPPAATAPAAGGPVPFGAGGNAPDWGARRVPGESLAGSPFAGRPSGGQLPAEQTSAGLPVRSPRASQTPGPTPGTPASQSTQGPQGPLGSTGSQALPTRGGGSDASRPMPSRGPVPRAPGTGSHALPQRSPDQARSRLAAFQRGNRRAEEQPGQSGQSSQFGQAPGAGEGSER
jgi:signal transduction histidine kinase